MILTEGEQMLVTPTGYVYEMYAPHQGAKSLRVRIETPDISFKKTNILQTTWQSALQVGEKMEGVIPTVAGSASLKGQSLFLTLTNSHAQEAAGVTVNILGGAKVTQVHGQVLAGEIHSHNTFSSPTLVIPQVFEVSCEPSRLNLTLPSASVAAVQIQLG
jgi:alpha-L-arabinofuranosidase